MIIRDGTRRERVFHIIFAIDQAMRKEGKRYTVDDLIIECSKSAHKNRNDEIKSRRSAWFLWGSELLRLEGLAKNNKFANDICAKIWLSLAETSPFLRALLPDNVVWDETEKMLHSILYT